MTRLTMEIYTTDLGQGTFGVNAVVYQIRQGRYGSVASIHRVREGDLPTDEEALVAEMLPLIAGLCYDS